MTPRIKRCTACFEVKVLADFSKHPTARDRLQSTCRSCQAEAAPKRRHGLTRVQKAEIAEKQGGCATCGTKSPGAKGWVVDHDHRCCGPVKSCARCRRGVLCNRCNTAMGMALDSPELLRRLADYLDSHSDRTSESHQAVAPATPYERTDGLTEKRHLLRGDLSVRTARVAGELR